MVWFCYCCPAPKWPRRNYSKAQCLCYFYSSRRSELFFHRCSKERFSGRERDRSFNLTFNPISRSDRKYLSEPFLMSIDSDQNSFEANLDHEMLVQAVRRALFLGLHLPVRPTCKYKHSQNLTHSPPRPPPPTPCWSNYVQCVSLLQAVWGWLMMLSVQGTCFNVRIISLLIYYIHWIGFNHY